MTRRIISDFVLEQREDFGTMGFQQVGYPWMDPTIGAGVAHDLLEHRKGDSGSMEEEMMAFGAAYYVRGETYFADTLHPIARHMAGDFPQFHSNYVGSGHSGPLTNPGSTHRLDDWIEDSITDMMRRAERLVQAEQGHRSGWIDHPYVRGWLRKGYRAARQRYKHVHPYELPYLFKRIEEDVDKLLLRDLYGGFRIRVVVKLNRCPTHHITEFDYEDD